MRKKNFAYLMAFMVALSQFAGMGTVICAAEEPLVEAYSEDVIYDSPVDESYFEEEPYPIMAFTPDSEYGICNAEKGIARAEISQKLPSKTIIKEFTGGSVVNAVPDFARVVVEYSDEDYKNIIKIIIKILHNPAM